MNTWCSWQLNEQNRMPEYVVAKITVQQPDPIIRIWYQDFANWDPDPDHPYCRFKILKLVSFKLQINLYKNKSSCTNAFFNLLFYDNFVYKPMGGIDKLISDPALRIRIRHGAGN